MALFNLLNPFIPKHLKKHVFSQENYVLFSRLIKTKEILLKLKKVPFLQLPKYWKKLWQKNRLTFSRYIGTDYNPGGIYLLKVNKRNIRTRCKICSKLTVNTTERRHWRRFDVFIVSFEHTSNLVLAFLLLTLNM